MNRFLASNLYTNPLRLILFIWAGILCVFALSACGGEEVKEEAPMSELAQVEEFWQKKDLENANKILKAYVEAHPKDIEAVILEARILLSQVRSKDTLVVLERGLAIEPENANLLALKGRAYYYVSHFTEALDFCRQALKKDPNIALPYLVIGEIFLRQGKVDDSIMVLKEAIKHDPQMVEALNKLSSALIKAKNFDAAKGYLEQALKIDTNDAGVQFNLALVYEKLNDGPNALKHIDEALRLYTENEDSHWKNQSRQMRNVIVEKFKLKA
jgi:tetratricopeptide (TPR) repeat protein